MHIKKCVWQHLLCSREVEHTKIKNLCKKVVFHSNVLFLGSWSVRKAKPSSPKVVQTRENIFKNIDFLCSCLEC